MNVLQITDQKAQQLDDVEAKALKILDKALETEQYDDVAKMAMQATSMVAKNRQTQAHAAAIGFGMIQSVGTDAQIKRYVEVTNPQVKRALTGKGSK
jgi:hypothetical protein